MSRCWHAKICEGLYFNKSFIYLLEISYLQVHARTSSSHKELRLIPSKLTQELIQSTLKSKSIYKNILLDNRNNITNINMIYNITNRNNINIINNRNNIYMINHINSSNRRNHINHGDHRSRRSRRNRHVARRAA